MTVQHQYPLQSLNTFGIKAQAEYFSPFSSKEELIELLGKTQKPLTVLGGGSNILLTKNINGTVLKNEISEIEITHEDQDSVTVKVGGGVVWHDFVMWSIEHNLGGIENLSLIPGSVGAAPMQNIGAYGVEIKSVFKELEAVHIDDKTVKTFNNKDCQFAYRYSIFKGELKGQYIICKVSFKLSKHPRFNTSYGAIEDELKEMGAKKSLKSISQAVINIRQRKLPNPKDIGNSGSFFKNPTIPKSQFEQLITQFPNIVGYPIGEHSIKVAAGWLIDRAGWKGYRKGDAGVHKNQALVLVNYGTAKGDEILALSRDIQKSIQETFGIELEAEVNIL
ncbi:MAG: UDP-N-acetylmuramate dehydrogenase [Flavobacteriales bacterium]|nr:UDP-N-acetylmuramate dehydrogenase [Flavobacteriales bacterium]MBL6872670.1 UDP-N-acetylmuramate dehydrogenase [Flavobacteriales bacterium]